jgi:hypothetical protein
VHAAASAKTYTSMRPRVTRRPQRRCSSSAKPSATRRVEIAGTVGRSEAADRQLATRVRSHVQVRPPRFDTDVVTRRRVTGALSSSRASRRPGGLLKVHPADRAQALIELGSAKACELIIGRRPGRRSLTTTAHLAVPSAPATRLRPPEQQSSPTL